MYEFCWGPSSMALALHNAKLHSALTFSTLAVVLFSSCQGLRHLLLEWCADQLWLA